MCTENSRVSKTGNRKVMIPGYSSKRECKGMLGYTVGFDMILIMTVLISIIAVHYLLTPLCPINYENQQRFVRDYR